MKKLKDSELELENKFEKMETKLDESTCNINK